MGLLMNLTGWESGPRTLLLALSSAPWAVTSKPLSPRISSFPSTGFVFTICHLRGGLGYLSAVLFLSNSEKLHDSRYLERSVELQ